MKNEISVKDEYEIGLLLGYYTKEVDILSERVDELISEVHSFKVLAIKVLAIIGFILFAWKVFV